MRLLLDNNLSHRVAEDLREAGHDAVHVRERGLGNADDTTILELAVNENRVLVTEDTDFGILLARYRAVTPSVVLFRSSDPLTPAEQVHLLLTNLEGVADSLAVGCVVSIGRGHLRVRPLPLRPIEGG